MVSPLKYGLKIFFICAFILVVSCQLSFDRLRILRPRILSEIEVSVVSCFAQSARYIRVLIAQDVLSLRLKISGFYEIIDAVSQKVLYRGSAINTTVTTYKNGILIAGKTFSTPKLYIRKAGFRGMIMIDDRVFKGNVQFIKKDNLTLSVINYIDLEDYIQGILYHEASHYWPMEALKAQAIACRSYAAYEMQQNRLRDYDVTADIYSQVYGGKTSERYRTNSAVIQTQGYLLTYRGEIFPAFYHATCAGHTTPSYLLWNIDIVPLNGVPCNFCQDSPHFSWHTILSESKLREKFIKIGYSLSTIKDILILDRDKSGRIINLRLVMEKKNIDISGKDFRNTVGPNIIRSTNFKVNLANPDVVFEGLGWGHGVGLCQWGAYFMAKQGYNYSEILKYYFPQTECQKNETIQF